MTKPGFLTSIDSGMTIRFIKVNGEPVRTSDLGIPAEWTPDGCEAVDAISTAVAGLITQHLAIPHVFVIGLEQTTGTAGAGDYRTESLVGAGLGNAQFRQGSNLFVRCASSPATTQMTIIPGNSTAWNAIQPSCVTGAVPLRETEPPSAICA